MKTTFYLIRHAQAEGNRTGRFQGATDLPLTPLGRQQLEYLAKRCSTLPVEAVFTSPLQRAYDTAQAVNRHLKRPLEVDPTLQEINCGLWENLPFDELMVRWPAERTLWVSRPWDFQSPGGESMQQVYDRVTQALERIAARFPGGSAAVVCHGCVLRNVFAFARGGIRNFGDDRDWVHNTSINVLELEDGVPRLLAADDCAHLPPELLTL